TAGGIGDDEAPAAAVPFGSRVEDPLNLGTHRIYIDVVVGLKIDRSRELLLIAGPVRVRRGREIRRRQHMAAIVPYLDDDIRQGDLLDLAELAVDLDGVTDLERVRECELNACDEVAQRRL